MDLSRNIILEIDLNTGRISTTANNYFYNTDRNIAYFYIKLYRTNIVGEKQYISETDSSQYKVYITTIKPKTITPVKLLGERVTNSDIDENIVYKITIPNELMRQQGFVYCEGQVIYNNQELTTDCFSFKVNPDKLTEYNLTLITDPDLPVLQDMINQVKQLKLDARGIDDSKITDSTVWSSEYTNTKFNDVDIKFNDVDTKVTEKFSNVDTKFTEKFTDVDTKFSDVNSLIKNNKTKIDYLDVHAQKIINDDTKFKENFLLKRNPFGTYQNAASFSIVTNSNYKVQVLGIPTENDKVLATYDNRDIVGIYNSVSTNNDNIFAVESCTFTQYTVSIPNTYDLKDIKEGMIIDTAHVPKFSGIIREINKDTNVITVYNWYQMGNESLGQIPTGEVGIKINNVTKIWNINTNLFLNEGDYNTAGCGFEMDIINHQPHVDNVDGFDLVLAGNYGGNNGYTARGQGNLQWLKGFVSNQCDTGFYAEDSSIGFRSLKAKMYAFLSNDNNISFCSKGTYNQKVLQSEVDGKVFTIKNDGSMSALGLDYVVGNADLVVNPYNSPVCIMTGNIQLVAPSECGKKYYLVLR